MSFTEVRSQIAMHEAGRCIYCGTTNDLSDEHVIPLALGGNLYLPKASCPKCRDITSRCEHRVLRGFMYRARVAGKFPTRRPGERPLQSTVMLLDGDVPREIVLPQKDSPAVLQLPTFEPAGLLVGRPKVRGISICGRETIGFSPDLKATVRKHAASGFRQTDTIEVTEFARMLAKIGYSYTVGLWGPVSVEQMLVLPFILGETDTAGYWVGSAQFQTESENRGALHGLTHFVYEGQADAGRRILVARVKLFASAGATGFEVVVRHV